MLLSCKEAAILIVAASKNLSLIIYRKELNYEMKAVVFDASVGKYIRTLVLGKISKKFFYNRLSCIQLKDIPEPKLPSENYVKIKTMYAGICGSDLNLIFCMTRLQPRHLLHSHL